MRRIHPRADLQPWLESTVPYKYIALECDGTPVGRYGITLVLVGS